MSGLEGISLPEWAVLFPLSVALGTSLYLGLLALSLMHLVPGAPDLPGDLDLLADPAAVVAAAALYLVAWLARGHRSVELLWGIANIPIRVVAVGLVGLLVVPALASRLTPPALLLSASVAGFIQFLRVGWIIIDHHFAWLKARRWILRLGVEAVAIGILWVTILSPPAGLALAACAVAVVIPWARAFRWAGRLALAVAFGGYRSAVGDAGWRGWDRTPRWIRAILEQEEMVRIESVRSAPAGLMTRGRGRTIRFGRLVWTKPRVMFLSRNAGSVRREDLSEMVVVGLGVEGHLLEVGLRPAVSEGPTGELILLVPPGGPEPEEIKATFAPVGLAKNL